MKHKPTVLEPTDIFSGRVRPRACGILVEDERILLIKHDGIGSSGHLWAPPGGGIDFGFSAEETVEKEFLEETGLNTKASRYMFTNEYRDCRHHAIELFFEMRRISGKSKLGFDPELPTDHQILTELRWFTWEEVKQLAPSNLHNSFHGLYHPSQITDLNGFSYFHMIS